MDADVKAVRVAVDAAFRDDEPRPCLSPAEALAAAPAVEQQRFRVPRILGED